MDAAFWYITIIKWIISFICGLTIGKGIVHSINEKDYLEGMGLVIVGGLGLYLLWRYN